MKVGDARATFNLYYDGRHGLSRYYTKASKLLRRAGELGYTKSYTNAGITYYKGEGVERDFKKAFHYLRGAIGGDGRSGKVYYR